MPLLNALYEGRETYTGIEASPLFTLLQAIPHHEEDNSFRGVNSNLTYASAITSDFLQRSQRAAPVTSTATTAA